MFFDMCLDIVQDTRISTYVVNVLMCSSFSTWLLKIENKISQRIWNQNFLIFRHLFCNSILRYVAIMSHIITFQHVNWWFSDLVILWHVLWKNELKSTCVMPKKCLYELYIENRPKRGFLHVHWKKLRNQRATKSRHKEKTTDKLPTPDRSLSLSGLFSLPSHSSWEAKQSQLDQFHLHFLHFL